MKSEFLKSNNEGYLDSKGATVLGEHGGKVVFLGTNIFCLLAIIFLLTKYTENPSAIIIGIVILLLIVAANFVEYFFVESDKFVVIYKSIFFLRFFDRRRVFNYSDIRKVKVTLKRDKKTAFQAFMINFLSSFAAFPRNDLEIEMNSGEIKYLKSKIYKEKLIPLLNFMQKNGVKIEIIDLL